MKIGNLKFLIFKNAIGKHCNKHKGTLPGLTLIKVTLQENVCCKNH